MTQSSPTLPTADDMLAACRSITIGSDKQIKWATAIRTDLIGRLHNVYQQTADMGLTAANVILARWAHTLTTTDDARWVIDNRYYLANGSHIDQAEDA